MVGQGLGYIDQNQYVKSKSHLENFGVETWRKSFKSFHSVDFF
jgi:hypothetical protein